MSAAPGAPGLLVPLGLRRADDPLILSSVKVTDALLKVDVMPPSGAG